MGADGRRGARSGSPEGSRDESATPGLTLSVPDALVDDLARRVAELLGPSLGAAGAWLDTAGAAEYLAAPVSRIHDLVARRELRCARDGRRLLFRREWLDAVLTPGNEAVR